MRSTLTQAAIDDPALRASYAHCRRTVRRDDPAEYAIMQLMPPALRPACWAMWAAASTADDIADAPGQEAADRAARLGRWTAALEAELPTGRSDDAVRHALIDTMCRWQLDLADLNISFTTLGVDTGGRNLATWREWSDWVSDTNLSWASQCMTLLGRAGIPVPLWLRRKDVYQHYFEGLYLTDTLTDLAVDLARDNLTLPAEALERYPHAAEHLAALRWTPAVEQLIGYLTEQARRWLDQPGLVEALHPGLAVMLDCTTRLFHARLDAVTKAGPKLLTRAPVPAASVRWRIIAPARARAALTWQLLPMALPRATRHMRQTPAARVPPQPRPVTVVEPPAPHPSGARPPAIPADRMPRHVAVIMDGNGRWATGRGLPRQEGHRIGGTIATKDIVHGALEIGLPYLTLYAFSTENWKRDPEEVTCLFDILRQELNEDYLRHDVRVRWAGNAEGLPEDLVEELLRVERNTRHRSALTVTVCLNYGGRAELTHAAARLARAATAGDLHPDRLREDDLANHLLLPDTPDVDLLWRTGGERRISNFLLWQAAYAELHFTDALWPDVDRRDLWQAITEYSTRQRRHGATPVPPRAKASVGNTPAEH